MSARRPGSHGLFNPPPQAFVALLKANLRAGELRREALHGDRGVPPTIMRGAPTHSCAHLLQALEEDGWRLVRHYPNEDLPEWRED